MLTALGLAAPGGFAVAAVVSYLAPDLVRRRSVVLRRVLAGLAAGVAVLAGTDPTGVAAVDAVLAPALAAGVTLLAGRARPWTVAAAAGAAAVVSVASPHPAIAFAAAGAALAMALTARQTPVAAALVGAALANAAIRLRLPGPSAVEVVVAAALLAPVAWSGYRRLRGKTRKRIHAAAFAAGAVVAPVALVGLVALAVARPGLERAVDRAGKGLDAARAADQAGAARHLEAAGEGFAHAHGALGAWWARPALALPVLGPHLRALRVVADTGIDLAGAGRQVATATDLGGLRIEGGRVPLDRIVAIQAPLRRASAEVTGALARLRRARSPWLVPPVADRLADNVARLTDADRSLRASRDVVGVLPRLLGGEGPRRWFLAIQTPSEGRGSGGFIGNYGEIVADRGQLDLARFGRIGELNTGGDPAARVLTGPADVLPRYERFDVATTWQNVTLSPDFPSVTRVIAGLYPQSGGRPVDGVIAVDPAGVAALLRLTGPLTVPPWPVPLTAKNAERILLYDQYAELPDSERVDFLGAASRLLWQRITSSRLPPVPKILDALGPAVAGKHLMVSAVDGQEDAALGRAGINGRLAPPRGGDALAVVTQNASGSKIDWFLRRRVDYRPTYDPETGKLSARLDVTLDNAAPPAGLPDYLIGSSLLPPLPRGTNRLYLSVYTPLGLSGARLDGAEVTVESEVEAGRKVYSIYVDIPPQGRRVLQLDLAGALAPGTAYRLGLRAQPLVAPDRVSVTLEGRPPRRLVLKGDETLRFGER